MGLIQEFKEFAVKGNVIDMAVGIIIGGAFGKIVTSLVNDVVMPGVGALLGGTDFGAFKLVLKAAVLEADGKTIKTPEAAIKYGAFINTCIDFFIVALSVFLMIKAINTLRRATEAHTARLAALVAAKQGTTPAATPEGPVQK
jgi:large conductance mechanosensitive channel